MGLLFAFALVAAAADGTAAPAAPAPTSAAAPAHAFVRILPGARVSLSPAAEADGYKLNSAVITVEDGSRRSAQLVEFQ